LDFSSIKLGKIIEVLGNSIKKEITPPPQIILSGGRGGELKKLENT